MFTFSDKWTDASFFRYFKTAIFTLTGATRRSFYFLDWKIQVLFPTFFGRSNLQLEIIPKKGAGVGNPWGESTTKKIKRRGRQPFFTIFAYNHT